MTVTSAIKKSLTNPCIMMMMMMMMIIIITIIIKPDVRGTDISHWADPVASLNEKNIILLHVRDPLY